MMKQILRKKIFIQFLNVLLMPFRDLFDRIDVNDDGIIDFNELLVLIAIRNQMGNIEQRLAFVFDLFVLIHYRFL
jgi:Ca2+-binding EF-hand superfamily protein